MRQKLIEHLKEVSAEEEKILKSSAPVLSHFVVAEGSNVVDRGKLIRPKVMIDVMKHLRFVDIPEHSHDFLEVSYMCTGSVRHVINGTTELTLQANDLLFLKCGAAHAIRAASYNDIAINFMILPEFLQYPLNMLTEDTMLRRFVASASRGGSGGYRLSSFSSSGYAGSTESAGKYDAESAGKPAEPAENLAGNHGSTVSGTYEPHK